MQVALIITYFSDRESSSNTMAAKLIKELVKSQPLVVFSKVNCDVWFPVATPSSVF